MNLLQIVVAEFPRKRFPKNADFVVKDIGSDLIKFFPETCRPEFKGRSWHSTHFQGCPLFLTANVPDRHDVLLTRSEMMKAYDLVERGFTLYSPGDEIPQGKIDYVTLSGYEAAGVESKVIHWPARGIVAFRKTIRSGEQPESPKQKFTAVSGDQSLFDLVGAAYDEYHIIKRGRCVLSVCYITPADLVIAERKPYVEKYIPAAGDNFFINHRGDFGKAHGLLRCVESNHKGLCFQYLCGDQRGCYDSVRIHADFIRCEQKAPVCDLPF